MRNDGKYAIGGIQRAPNFGRLNNPSDALSSLCGPRKRYLNPKKDNSPFKLACHVFFHEISLPIAIIVHLLTIDYRIFFLEP